MQLLEHWDPLNLPRGSVRSIVTLTLLGVLWAQMVLEREVSLVFASLVLLVVGHYFGSRNRKTAEGKKPPLGLPSGTVRVIIILGFGAVAFHLWRQGKLPLSAENRNTTILVLVGALLLGFVIRALSDLASSGQPTKPRQLFENVKAVAVLLATAVLALASTLGTDEATIQNVALATAPIIGMYFGSRY